MSGTNQVSEDWALRRAMLLGALCLAVGLAAGWLIRGWESPVAPTVAASAPVQAGSAAPSANAAQQKQQADAQAAPILEQLKAQPENADLLTNIGNIYYDAQLYPTAIDYYTRSLKAKPADASVRTDLGTAYWYLGNADSAIKEFDTALTYAPTNPNTLFNRGLVKWQGKGDAAGASADWKKLLATNPNYEAKDKVEQMLAQVEKHTNIGMKGQ
ncbi:tetratricopeptide repeat protein [Occallatibacter riparius]|uniref:Tetratricopeptide repeat protein n=1 Tax=Occallatibacter riparius TaxID=1002689 RepID=A0A9J7BRG7_9BACT|nr:tetratricopeptide repeat protein [Occallatibacter riparius]UWZ85435.1 tetratricopeptide repeat protein [Occallatibacter riparius]